MHEGHRKRMKERFLKDGGFENFAQHEILEMLLYSTISRGDTNPVAHELIKKFGSLANVLEASPQELKEIHGVGESSAFLLSMIPALSRAYADSKWSQKICLSEVDVVGQYAINLFLGKAYEEFRIICVDANRQLLYQGCVAKGTINEVPAYPRVVVEEILKRKAQKVYLTHNHPGGTVRSSQADIEATKEIIRALEAVDIEVLDHIIVSGNCYYSMANMHEI